MYLPRFFVTLLLATGVLWHARPAPARAADAPDGPDLRVSDNHRFLVKADGSPFFYLGDTAWELFHRLNRDEADLYLKDRADKGFTVIQAVVLAEYGGLTEPNAYGDLPLTGNDPAKPNEAYFKHVDYVVDKAASLGLYVGMLPTWGDKVNKKWGQGPEIFTAGNAVVFGEFLGKRYKDKPVIWILGGDRPVENDNHMADLAGDGRWASRKGDGRPAPDDLPHQRRAESSADTARRAVARLQHAPVRARRRDLPNYDMIAKDYARQADQAVPGRRAALRGPPDQLEAGQRLVRRVRRPQGRLLGASSPARAATPTAATTSGSSTPRPASPSVPPGPSGRKR